MKVVVGLGNVGKQFENTRHNVGFLVVDYFLKKLKVKLDQENFDCFYTLAKINNDNFLFAKPTTLMNLSGNCVQKILNYYHVASENLIVFSDDLDQDLGKYKTRTSCSCGGHNGLRDISTKIKTDNYLHFKIGIGRPKDKNIKDYVLGKFNSDDLHCLKKIFEKAYKLLQLISLNSSINIALSKLNN